MNFERSSTRSSPTSSDTTRRRQPAAEVVGDRGAEVAGGADDHSVHWVSGQRADRQRRRAAEQFLQLPDSDVDDPLAAHTTAGRTAGLTETDIMLARQTTATDPAEAALLAFAVQVLVEPLAPTDQDLAELHDHDWSDRAIADVIGLVALSQLTGSFNLIAGRQPDATPKRRGCAA